jgi:hypothetical protein
MAMPEPYAEADERTLVDGCISEDVDAWRVLDDRYAALFMAVAVRVVDERREGTLEEVPACLDHLGQFLRRDGAAVLRGWRDEASLRCYLTSVARSAMASYLQDVTPPATSLHALPTPVAIFVESAASMASARVTGALERFTPHISAMARLRLRGLDHATIGVSLGMPPVAVRSTLERVAERLAEDGDSSESVSVWRVLLDAAPTSERVTVAIRAEDDDAFREIRDATYQSWRFVKERVLKALQPRTPQCFDDRVAAALVDGTLKGAERTRAEGHVASCPRCADMIAQLTLDIRAIDFLRELGSLGPKLAVAASCAANGRYRAAELLAEQAALENHTRARDVARLARVGHGLYGTPFETRFVETSQVVATKIPTDQEAPLVALETLVSEDLTAAARAIDDQLAKGALGLRLRLLTAARGQDLERAHDIAKGLEARSHSDPGLLADAEAVRALSPGRVLPREILVERLRDVLPGAVRFMLRRGSDSSPP